MEEAFKQTITVPYPLESTLSGIADVSYRSVVWYRRQLQVPGANDERLLQHFGAVDRAAQMRR